nr:MAG TPA: hypothetical protein [Caudoviricetes sp.]
MDYKSIKFLDKLLKKMLIYIKFIIKTIKLKEIMIL